VVVFDGYITGFFESSNSVFINKKSTVTSTEESCLFYVSGHVEWRIFIVVPEESNSFIFRVKKSKRTTFQGYGLLMPPCLWSHSRKTYFRVCLLYLHCDYAVSHGVPKFLYVLVL
jgi:hypothetical protein